MCGSADSTVLKGDHDCWDGALCLQCASMHEHVAGAELWALTVDTLAGERACVTTCVCVCVSQL